MALTCGMFMPAYATEIDDTKKKAEELENKKKTAESEKTSLANQLSNLVNEMEKTKKKISDKESEISNKEDELILAKAKENDQYESMKKRICNSDILSSVFDVISLLPLFTFNPQDTSPAANNIARAPQSAPFKKLFLFFIYLPLTMICLLLQIVCRIDRCSIQHYLKMKMRSG